MMGKMVVYHNQKWTSFCSLGDNLTRAWMPQGGGRVRIRRMPTHYREWVSLSSKYLGTLKAKETKHGRKNVLETEGRRQARHQVCDRKASMSLEGGREPKSHMEQFWLEGLPWPNFQRKWIREQAFWWSNVAGGNPKKLKTSVVWEYFWENNKEYR